MTRLDSSSYAALLNRKLDELGWSKLRLAQELYPHSPAPENNRAQITKWLSGGTTPTPTTQARLNEALGVTESDLSECRYITNIDFASVTTRNLISRSAEISRIESHFFDIPRKNSSVIGLTGLTGVGKTTVGLKYALHTRNRYNIQWIIDARSNPGVHRSFDLLISNKAPRLGQMPAITKRNAFFQFIESLDTPCLFVFDDAISLIDLFPLLPPTNAHALVTSQNANLFAADQRVEIESIDVVNSTVYLSKNRKTEEDAARKLALILGGLPLALDQARVLCDQAQLSYSEYVDRVDYFLSVQPVEATFGASTFAAISLSIEYAIEKQPDSFDVLALMSHSPKRSLPKLLLDRILGTEVCVETIINLRSLSLVETNAMDGHTTCSAHSLVALTMKNLMRGNAFSDQSDRFVHGIADKIIEIDNDDEMKFFLLEIYISLFKKYGNLFRFSDSVLTDSILKIAEQENYSIIVDTYEARQEFIDDAIQNQRMSNEVRIAIGKSYRYLGNEAGARDILSGSMKFYRDNLIEYPSQFLENVKELAGLYRESGDFDSANNLYESVLFKQNAMYDAERFSSLKNSYAISLMEAGNNESAETIFRELLEKDLENSDPFQYYHRINNLGLCLINQNRAEEAVSIYEEIEKYSVDQEITETTVYATWKNNMGILLLHCSDAKNARKAFFTSAKLHQHFYTRSNWRTCSVICNYATSLAFDGRARLAELFFEFNIAQVQGALGSKHWRVQKLRDRYQEFRRLQ